MKELTDIHNRLSNPTCVGILWLLFKYGDIPVKDLVYIFASNQPRFSFIQKGLESVNLISTYKNKDDSRVQMLSLKKDYASIYSYTLFMLSEDPDILEIERKYLANRK